MMFPVINPLSYASNLSPQQMERRHRQFMAHMLSRPSSHPKNHKKNVRAKLAKRPQIEARHRRQKKNAKRTK